MPELDVIELLERVPDPLLVLWTLWGIVGVLLKLASTHYRHRMAENRLSQEVESVVAQSQMQYYALLDEIKKLKQNPKPPSVEEEDESG